MKVVATGVSPALLLGLLVMIAHGAPPALPAINLVSALLASLAVCVAGARLAALVASRPVWVASVALGLQLGTLAAPGIDGVQRWIAWGGVRLHPAAVLDPVMLLAVVVLWLGRRTGTATAFVAAGLALHAVQPDAGQATALAAASLVLALTPGPRWWMRLALSAVALTGAAVAWMRPDPLPPVEFVENIVPLAFALHPLIGTVAVASLAALPTAALWRSRGGPTAPAATPRAATPRAATPRTATPRTARPNAATPNAATPNAATPNAATPNAATPWAPGRREPHLTLAAYLSASILVVLFGEFPTPVLGFGASPVVGAVLGLGLLGPVRRRIGPEPRRIPHRSAIQR